MTSGRYIYNNQIYEWSLTCAYPKTPANGIALRLTIRIESHFKNSKPKTIHTLSSYATESYTSRESSYASIREFALARTYKI